MTNNKSAEEIVRALRTCNNPKGHRCSECPVFSRYEYRICKATVDRQAAALIESQAAEIAELRAENESLATNGGKYMAIAEKRYEMYEEAIKRAEAAEVKLAAYERRIKND